MSKEISICLFSVRIAMLVEDCNVTTNMSLTGLIPN